MNLIRFAACLFLAANVASHGADQTPKTPQPPPKSTANSLSALKLHPGFVAELVANEPMVQDPIAFDWGADGKLWIVEMGDYPLGIDGKGLGKVKVLESFKRDGHYDRMTVFLDNLPFPTGVTAWKKGVLVFCPPDLFYAEDTNGDGIADKREVLFTGFKEGNPQHRANGLVRGLDNWLYGANGDSGGKIKSLKTGDVIDIGARDFRIRPDEGIIETVSGRTQFGRTRDDWGNWFGSMNSAPLYHYPIEERYLRRNPHAILTSTSVKFGDHQLFPISGGVRGFNYTGRFTSACSPAVYRDELFGAAFENSIFESEPAHNLVHREVLKLEGSTFTSERAADEPDFDFFASGDAWCRPATIKVGPDGALWIADMYRYVIEHPQWILKDVQARVDLRAGEDRGRIYRVFPKNTTPRPFNEWARIGTLSGAELVNALDSPSGWQRDTVQELIVQRQEKSLGPLLEKLALSAGSPKVRLQALCTLDGLSALRPEILKSALGDKHDAVRIHALRLSEPFLKTEASLVETILAIPDETNGLFNLQLACTLGGIDDSRAAERLSKIALQNRSEPFITAAVLSSLNAKNYPQTMRAAFQNKDSDSAALLGKLATLAPHLADDKTFANLLTTIVKPDNGTYAAWQLDAFAIFLDSLGGANVSLGKLLAKEGSEFADAKKNIEAIVAYARASLTENKTPAERCRAIKLLGRGIGERDADIDFLAKTLSPRFDSETQSAAVTALATMGDARIGDILLAGWRGYNSTLRTQVLQAASRKTSWTEIELSLLEAKKILPNEFDASQRQRLLWHTNPAIKARAEKIFEGAVNPDRQKVVDAFKPALSLKGIPESGAKIFAEKCATCHRLGNVGTAVGPNLDALTDNSHETLLIAILDPNRAIEPRYINYLIVLNDGVRVSGLIDSESPTAISVLEAGGKRTAIAREHIKSMTGTGMSLMPEGLETGLSAQDVANLLAYIRSFKVVAPGANGKAR